jgi:hypothetical protein
LIVSPAAARSMVAMSIFRIVIIASIARLAAALVGIGHRLEQGARA